MKHNKIQPKVFTFALMIVIAVLSLTLAPNVASASGGGGSGGSGSSVDTIKVNKCYEFDTGAYVELLLNAVSSNSNAHLYAYLPDGTYLGEVQNGGGGRYGGTVFVTLYVPASITFVSSYGGMITVSTQPFQF